MFLLVYKTNITMSSQIDHLIPLFNGSDYHSWATSMTAYLHSVHLWGIVSGRESRPSDLPSGRAAVAATQTTPAQPAIPAPTQEQVSERQVAQCEWVEKDEQALGIIQLRLSHHLHTLIGITSYRTWRSIEDSYGKPGAALIFADFKALNAFRLSGSNPAPEISKMVTLLERLCANHCQFSEFVQTMILLSHSHLHLASVASVEPTIVVPPLTPAPQVYLRAKDIPANAPPGLSLRMENQGQIFYQPLTHMGLKQNAQAFTGAPQAKGKCLSPRQCSS